MRKRTRAGRNDGRRQRQSRAQPIGDVLEELLALYSARFPQFKFVIIGPANQPTNSGRDTQNPLH